MRYNNLSAYLRERYGKRIGKICIDGGFSCPNRDGSCGVGGCIFCGERGAGEHIDGALAIREQVDATLFRGSYEGYIAYFQNFTNTYAPIDVLRERYDAALGDERIVALAIGTRPDCIDDNVAALIAEYGKKLDVWVELGLQTASDEVARVINRGYTTDVFLRAAKILTEHGIPFVVHMMIGLPGEGRSEARETARLIASVHPFGVKIHSLYVMEGTVLAEMYRSGTFTPIGEDEYVAATADCLELLPPETVIHRLTGDCPEGMLVAPLWSKDKNRLLAAIRNELERRGTRQGSRANVNN